MGPRSLPERPDDSDADAGSGARLGKYEIVRRLARGGMAEILLATVRGTLPGFRKLVVLKRILPEFAREPSFVRMFVDEARLAASLQHANIVQVFDVGFDEGSWFMAMEHLHGEDVRAISRAAAGGRVPVEHALHIGLSVAAGLHYAHERLGEDGKPLGLVHRDVSPQNVIVTFDGAVKLVDFGIAKTARRVSHTAFGELKGKVPYMSPEQCGGEDFDRRSDVYSLGIILYELTVGRRLHQGRSDFEVMHDIIEGRVRPPRELASDYDPRLEAIVMRALEKDRARRYPTARELQEDLEDYARGARLFISPTGAQAYVEELFAGKVRAWRDAQAEGLTLAEFLEKQEFEGVPVELREPSGERSTAPSQRRAETELRPRTLTPSISSLQRRDGLTGRSRRLVAVPLGDAPERERADTPFELPMTPSSAITEALPLTGGAPIPPSSQPTLPFVPAVHSAGPSQKTMVRLAATPPPITARPTMPLVPAQPAPAKSRPQPRREPPAARPASGRGLAFVMGALVFAAAMLGARNLRRAPHPKEVASPPVAPARPIGGSVQIETDPSGAILFLDGKALDRRSPTRVDDLVTDRDHVLRASAPGHVDAVELFTIEPGAYVRLSIALAPFANSPHEAMHERAPRR